MFRLTLLALLFPAMALAQSPEASVVLEEVAIPGDVATTLDAALGAPARTFRLYAVIPDNYELQIVFGDQTDDLAINSTGGFYQALLGGPTAEFIDPDQVALFPELGYDSWLTIGDDDADGNMSVLYPFEAVFAGWELGGDLLINDMFGGGVLISTFGMNSQSTGDADGKVLIGQFTVAGDVFGQVNFQIRRLNPDGSIYDPPGDDVSETEVFVDMDFSSIIPDTSLCETDLNGDNKTDTDDLLIVIGDFGCATLTCIGDLNASDSVDAADVLFLLSAFGTDCE
ncbi:MAG: hypothetical protein ACPF83_09170 [Flavobacteriales bacterium]